MSHFPSDLAFKFMNTAPGALTLFIFYSLSLIILSSYSYRTLFSIYLQVVSSVISAFKGVLLPVMPCALILHNSREHILVSKTITLSILPEIAMHRLVC